MFICQRVVGYMLCSTSLCADLVQGGLHGSEALQRGQVLGDFS
jgi:hypothetical protein